MKSRMTAFAHIFKHQITHSWCNQQMWFSLQLFSYADKSNQIQESLYLLYMYIYSIHHEGGNDFALVLPFNLQTPPNRITIRRRSDIAISIYTFHIHSFPIWLCTHRHIQNGSFHRIIFIFSFIFIPDRTHIQKVSDLPTSWYTKLVSSLIGPMSMRWDLYIHTECSDDVHTEWFRMKQWKLY